MATNASRFVTYKLTSRNAFLGRNNEPQRNTSNVREARSTRTLLVPETNRTEEELFRQTFWSNFTKNGALTNRSEDGEETKNNSPEQENPALQSNGFSTTAAQNQSVAKYKVIKDIETIGDGRLIEQEAKYTRNLYNLIFFFSLVILL